MAKVSCFNLDGTKSLDFRLSRGAVCFSDDPGLTEQSHKDSCDINFIMRQYEKTGQVPVYTSKVPMHGDFVGVFDYQTALNMVIEADEAFDSLPASVRKEYDNSPSKFLAALDDPEQRSKLIELGVLVDDRKPSGASQSGSEVVSGSTEA